MRARPVSRSVEEMGRTDQESRTINASSVRVYKALITPEKVARWLPPEGMSARVEAFDPRPGGECRMVLTYDDPAGAPGKSSASEDIVSGRFTEVEPGVRVTQKVGFDSDDPAFAGVMTMTWEVVAEGASTLVTVCAEDVPEGIDREQHLAGMRSSLENLARLVER